MKISSSLILMTALLGVTMTAEMLFISDRPQQPLSILENVSDFGAKQIIKTFEGRIEKELTFNDDDLLLLSEERQLQYVQKQMDDHADLEAKKAAGTLGLCKRGQGPDDSFFKFLPVNLGNLSPKTLGFQYNDGHCFEKHTFAIAFNPPTKDFDSIVITIESSGQKEIGCQEMFFFASLRKQHLEMIFFDTTTQLTINGFSDEDRADIAANGIRTYMFCMGIEQEVVSVMNTLRLFFDMPRAAKHQKKGPAKVPHRVKEANLEFQKQFMNVTLGKRSVVHIDVDPNLIQSGDLFIDCVLNAQGTMIRVGTGSRVNHVQMALRMENGDLYIIESCENGIEKTPWAQYNQLLKDSDDHYQLLWVQLNAESRAKWNNQAAIDFFRICEGMPYGFHNFLYTWIDTPFDNLQSVIPKGFLPIMFSMISEFDPELVEIFFTSGMNKHLGVEGKSIVEIAAIAGQRGLTMDQVMAIPEQEYTWYKGLQGDKKYYSYVCSNFLVALYKKGGLLGNLNIQSTEFGPRDVYMLDLYHRGPAPEVCRKHEIDVTVTWCQIHGEYRVHLPELNTLKPFDNMAETCPTQGPLYPRPAKC